MKHHRRLASVAIFALALTGCAQAAEAAPEQSAPAEQLVTTIDNCGTEIALSAPPQRVLALKSTSIEMMLALGQQDRVVGTAYQDGPFAEAWADRGTDLMLIDERVPSSEAALELEPDFIYAGWESMLTDESIGDRDALAGMGVSSYVSPAACQGPGYRPDAVTFEHVYEEIREIGTLFEAQDEAERLIADMQSRLAATRPDERGLTALWFSSGSDIPFVGAGTGAPQMVMDAAGLQNIASEVAESWVSMGWEAILDADPDVIVLVDSTWNSAEKKIALLEQHAPTLTAVARQNYLIVPFATTEAGVRSVEAVEVLLAQLAEMTTAPSDSSTAPA